LTDDAVFLEIKKRKIIEELMDKLKADKVIHDKAQQKKKNVDKKLEIEEY